MLIRTLLAVATVSFVAAAPARAAPDAARGAKLFEDRCAMCHSLAADDNGMGPSLSGAYGRPTGRAPGFAYSPGLAAHKASWTDANLDRFLTDPQAFSPGSEMPVSVPSADDRADLIAYLAKAAK